MTRRFALILAALFFAAPCWGIGFVRAGWNQTVGTATTVTVTITAGDLAVISCYQGVNNTSTLSITDSASQTGWVQAGGYVSADSASRQAMFYHPNSAALTTVTGTWSGSLSATIPCDVFDVSAAALSTPLDANGSNPASSSNTATGTSLGSGTLSTSNTNDILIYAVGTGVSSTGWTNGTGYTLPTGGSGGATSGRLAMQYQVVAATQSGVTTTMSWTTTGAHRTGIFAAFANTNQGGGGGPTPGFDKRRKLDKLEEARR